MKKNNKVEDLGPNWRTVLNFWLWLESLDKDYVLEHLIQRNQMPYNERDKVDELTMRCFSKVASPGMFIPYISGAELFATYEIIAAQQILDEAGKLTFLPMFEGL